MVLRTAWPIVVSRLSYVLMGVVDMLLVARLGTAETAAVGLGVIATFTVFCFGFGLLNSVKVVTAQAVGAGRPHRSSTALAQGMVLGGILGAAMMWLLPEIGIVQLVGGRGDVVALGTQYFDIRVFAAVPLFIGNAIFGHIEGAGDTRTPMRAAVAANALNLVLTAGLVFGVGPFPALGAAGAAWGTAIASASMGAWAVYLILQRYGRLALDNFRGVGELLRLGIPMGLEFFVYELSWLMFAAFVTSAGKAHLAAHVIAARLMCLTVLPGHGISAAAMILVGQATGAGDRAAARDVQRRALRFAFGVMGLGAVVFALFGGALVSAFTADAEVVAVGGVLLIVAGALQLFESVVLVRSGSLQGAGDTFFVMAVNIAAAWGLLVPGALIGCAALGAVGGWLARLGVLALLAVAFEARARFIFGVEEREQLLDELLDIIEIHADVAAPAIERDQRIRVAAA